MVLTPPPSCSRHLDGPVTNTSRSDTQRENTTENAITVSSPLAATVTQEVQAAESPDVLARPQPELTRPINPLSPSLTIRLYTSHFLSTWNSRVFEFAAVLFLASIFPQTLLPMSVYALVRCGAAIVFSPAVGHWIDKSDRLVVVRASIVGQRMAVAASCGILWAMESKRDMSTNMKQSLFAVTVLLACVEKLCSVANLVSVERDWVVVITEGNEHSRRVLNARIRRIDLLCKLLGPLAISLIAGASTVIAIWAVLGMNLGPLLVEYLCIAQVYRLVPELKRSGRTRPPEVEAGDGEPATVAQDASATPNLKSIHSRIASTVKRILPLSSIPLYVRHAAFLPSLSLSLLYLTVLSLSGQMITFLLSVGYTSTHVGIVRTISTALELSATWIAPRLIGRIGAIRAGIWSLSWQMIWLAGGLSWFFTYWAKSGGSGILAASGLVGGVALSRIGLWSFDLCAQNIVQDEVDDRHRGAFSTVEASAQNLFELLSYATTIIFTRPDQFQWPVVVSIGAVYAAGGLYTWYVRERRGHLLHSPQCLKRRAYNDSMTNVELNGVVRGI